MMRRISWVVIPLALTGCGGEGDTLEPASVESPAPNVAAVPPSATPSVEVGGARQISEETDTFLFEYSYPQAAGEISGLATWLDRRLERNRSRLASESARGREEARDNGFPFNKYSSSTEWKVVANLPNWLSLSAELSSYSGGAHGNFGFDTMVWDKERDIALEPIGFFTSPEALDAALNEQLCEALNAERAERRGEPVAEASDEGFGFDACVKVDETNVLLGSRGGEKFDRIGVQIAPYVAGPYAEGSYEFTFDMTRALLETVRPEYRDAFAARN